MKPFYWALLTALTWGCVPILEKLGLAKIPAVIGLFYRSLGVVLGAIILFAWKFESIKEVFFSSPRNWLFVLAGGILASVVGQLFFYHALKGGEASKVVPLAGIYPLVSFILGVIFFSETITVSKVAGLSFILLGVFLLR